jgi:hypothetical protein
MASVAVLMNFIKLKTTDVYRVSSYKLKNFCECNYLIENFYQISGIDVKHQKIAKLSLLTHTANYRQAIQQIKIQFVFARMVSRFQKINFIVNRSSNLQVVFNSIVAIVGRNNNDRNFSFHLI